MSQNADMESSSKKFPLLRLPREIRQEIFSYLVDFGVVAPSPRSVNLPFEVWWFDADQRRILRHDAILYTSRLLYREALPILRKVRLIVPDCRVITPLAKSMDQRSRSVLRSLSLNRNAIEQRGIWEEACRELDKLELRNLDITVEGTDESLRSASREDTLEERIESRQAPIVPTVGQQPAPQIGWVDNLLNIKRVRKLSIKMPDASALEGEVNQYLQSRMMDVEVGG